MSAREEAAHWQVLLSSPEATDLERAQFEAWIASDVNHAREYRQIERIWNELDRAAEFRDLIEPAPKSAGSNRDVSLHRTVRRRHATKFALAAGITAIACGIAIFLQQNHYAGGTVKLADQAQQSTPLAHNQELKLPDGTQVTLGARSAIAVDFTASQRRVVLNGGEAFFDVAQDSGRPFVVSAAHTQVQALGTQFNVHFGTEDIRVSVLEGRVAVISNPTTQTHKRVVLGAGQAVRSTKTGEMAPAADINRADAAAWREGRLVYVNESLRNVVADANRYSEKQIVLATEELGDLRITAGFRTQQIDQMIRSLSVAHSLNADYSRPGRIVLSRAP